MPAGESQDGNWQGVFARPQALRTRRFQDLPAFRGLPSLPGQRLHDPAILTVVTSLPGRAPVFTRRQRHDRSA